MPRARGLVRTGSRYLLQRAGMRLQRRAARVSRPLAALSTLVLVGLVAAPATTAQASGPQKSSTNVAPLTLVSQSISTNPNAPPWCLTEDDWTQSTYIGSLNGSYDATATLCGLPTDFFNGIWWNAGGIGLESDLYSDGQLTDLAFTAPDGTAHHAILMGETTVKHVTTYHYAVCYVPPYSLTSDTGGTPLPGGVWNIDLSGTLSSATWYVNALMTDVAYQQQHCPVSEQNLAP